MAFSLDDGREKEAFVKGFRWSIENPDCSEYQLRLGPSMALRMMQAQAFCEAKYSFILQLFKHDRLETSDKELGDESDNFGATTSEKEGESKGKGAAPEPSDIGASATKNSAMDFHADWDIHLWDERISPARPSTPASERSRRPARISVSEARLWPANLLSPETERFCLYSACPLTSPRARGHVGFQSLVWGASHGIHALV